MTSDPKYVLDPYHMNLARYTKRVVTYMNNFTAQYGTPVGDLTTRQIVEIVDAIAEQLRREFKLSESDHNLYKQAILVKLLGPDKGRKGTTR